MERKGRGPTVRPGKLFAPTFKRRGDTCEVAFRWNPSEGPQRTTKFIVAIGKDENGEGLTVAKLGEPKNEAGE